MEGPRSQGSSETSSDGGLERRVSGGNVMTVTPAGPLLMEGL